VEENVKLRFYARAIMGPRKRERERERERERGREREEKGRDCFLLFS